MHGRGAVVLEELQDDVAGSSLGLVTASTVVKNVLLMPSAK